MVWYVSMKNVLAGFRVCGVYPFNWVSFDLPEEQYTSFKSETLPQVSGLKYIPLYCPLRFHAGLSGSIPSPTSPSQFLTPIECSGSAFSDSVDSSFECSMTRSCSDSSLYDRSFLTP